MIKFYLDKKDNFVECRVLGHANYSSEGNDIVCAGVSALVQTFIQNLYELKEKEKVYAMNEKIESGNVCFSFYVRDEDKKEYLRIEKTIIIGLMLINNKYPENLCLRI